ncbi:hypothetical protein C0J52_18511 [Blattella germanica]|nr:hypothetical protein C0J52_18511 [Blattella germanica]
MATSGVERAFCVLEFDKEKSATNVQRKFRTNFNKEAPSRKSIYASHDKFVTTGCLCPKKTSGLIHKKSEKVCAQSIPRATSTTFDSFEKAT